MIKIYRKKTTIKAEQFDGSQKMIRKYDIYVPVMLADGCFGIETLEGDMDLIIGDWIATGVKDEHWPIADDVFEQTYAELPVIPEPVSRYINLLETDYDLGDAFNNVQWASGTVPEWINTNSNKFARAWLDGYQVEAEHVEND